MERRQFLRSIIAAGVGAALDPEQLLWTPKAMITVPAMPHHWKAGATVQDWRYAMRVENAMLPSWEEIDRMLEQARPVQPVFFMNRETRDRLASVGVFTFEDFKRAKQQADLPTKVNRWKKSRR